MEDNTKEGADRLKEWRALTTGQAWYRPAPGSPDSAGPCIAGLSDTERYRAMARGNGKR